jgi:hypothetical protein
MPYTLGQAAKASGRSKATIHRAVKAGRLSGARSATGGWLIDPAELHRVYPPSVSGDGLGDGQRDTTQPLANGSDRVGERVDVALLRERITEQAETIRDLRERLDRADERVAAEVEERRRLLALLTDQRNRPWWRRWFR